MPPVSRKRPLPKPSLGGADLLDSIMGGISGTMQQLPTRPQGAASRKQVQFAEEEMATHFGMVRAPPTTVGMREDRNVCRNPECHGSDFDTDWRQGDRICRLCGCVQNNRSVECHDEEHRTFADDDKKESKQRTSKVMGPGVTNVSGALARVHKLTESNADAEDGISERDRKRIDAYKGKVRDLANILELHTGQITLDAQQLADDLVRSQILHEQHCGKPGGTCRLRLKQQSAALIGAALLKEAMRKHGVDRLFEELKSALKGDDVDAADASKVGRTTNIVSDLLKGRDLLKGHRFPFASSNSLRR